SARRGAVGSARRLRLRRRCAEQSATTAYPARPVNPVDCRGQQWAQGRGAGYQRRAAASPTRPAGVARPGEPAADDRAGSCGARCEWSVLQRTEGDRMISAVFVDRPRLAVVIAIVITIAGLLALTRIPVAQFPDIVPPQVQVSAVYPGASAAVVEESIGQPIEAQVVGVDKMIYMKSTSAN